MNIARKMLVGFGVVMIPVFVVLVSALSSLDQMDKISMTILKTNNPVIERTERLIENLLDQESYSRRILILKDNNSLKLLQTRLGEFNRLLRELDTAGSYYESVRELSSKGWAFLTLLTGTYGSLDTALAASEKQRWIISRKRQEIIKLVKKINVEVRQNMDRKNELSAKIGMRAYKALLIFGIGSVLMAAGITYLFTRSVYRSVGRLKLSLQQISDSNFDKIQYLESKDEFGEVSRSIADMAQKIELLEKLYLVSSPLTLLPGGLSIDETIGTRLSASLPTALCMIDIDNFKVFNDRYGYGRGNEVIQATAKIITECARELGLTDDFIGHIGGDDFVVVTSPEKYEKICEAIIKDFDNQIPAFYDLEDRQRGAIVGKDRQGRELVFPLMTISIGIATDQGGSIKNPLVLSKLTAKLKEHAKSLPGSVYIVDQRHFSSEGEA